MTYEYNIKPDKKTFVGFRFWIGTLRLAAIILVLGLVSPFNIWLPLLGVLVVVRLGALVILNIKFKKEKYIFLKDKIIYKSGGIFSDRETELVIRNITHVKLRKPWLQDMITKSANIRIESAGSGLSEVSFFGLKESDKVYDYIMQMMRYNGFSLKMDKKIQEEKPHPLGVFFEVFKNVLITLAVILYIGFDFIVEAKSGMDSIPIEAIIGVAALVLLYLVGRSLLSFLDLSKRIYDVYDDTITYNEGFLSKHKAFIPVENLSDTTLTQTIVDKMFSLYDVKISCQGSQQEILFKNMKNGLAMKDSVDKVISGMKGLAGKKGEVNVPGEKVSAKTKVVSAKQASAAKSVKLEKNTDYTAEFKMNGRRAMFKLWVTLPICIILLPLLLFWIGALIYTLIELKNRKYFVRKDTMEEEFNFLARKNKEFSNDKIMGLVFKESFIDKWFNTFSVVFWSIGSSDNIKFKHLKKEEGIYDKLIAKIGIKPEQAAYKMDSKFSFGEFIKAELGIIFVKVVLLIGLISGYLVSPAEIKGLFLVAIGVVILVMIGIILLNKKVLSYSKMTYFKNYLYHECGWLFKKFIYVPYENVKDITTIKYPASKMGSVKFNIAGETAIKTKNGTTYVSNGFKIRYIENIKTKDELIDNILFYRPSSAEITSFEDKIKDYKPKIIKISKPDLANILVPAILVSVVIFPLLVILPITIIGIVWTIKVKSYTIEDYRIMYKSGIIYKRQQTIVFRKIDHIKLNEGMLNKMFSNGSITVNTIGSSMSEMKITNVSDYKEFYEELKKHY